MSQRVVRELASTPKSLRYLYPDVLWGILSHTRGELKGEHASATLLRQHLRFGTHERCKPTSIGGKAACERERWMRTDDVKWIGQTDRRDRHNSPSKQYLGEARHPGDTCRFPLGNIGLSSRARFCVRVRVRVRQHSKNSFRNQSSAFMYRNIKFRPLSLLFLRKVSLYVFGWLALL